jgi:uncharacterized membrane protein
MTKAQVPAAAPESGVQERVRRVESLISGLLRAGVLISLTLVIAGTLLSFARNPDYLSSRFALQRLTEPGAAFPHTLREVLAGSFDLNGQAIVTIGLLLLIATPVIRVGVSIFAFVYERDRVYAFITAVVFCLLLLSFVLGKVE